MESQVKYGQELGPNLIKIAKKLLQNDNLLMLLENTDLEPLNKTLHPEKLDGMKFLHKLVRVVPLITTEEQNTKSKVVVLFDGGSINNINGDNENISVRILVYSPFKEWLIAGDTIRPFAIMSEVRKSLQNKRINGLGEIKYRNFDLSALTDEMSCYSMRFEINAFS